MPGPSFSGPRSGWTAASLAPTVPSVQPQFTAPTPGPSTSGPAAFRLSSSDLGGAEPRKRDLTPLESLLSAIYPNAVGDDGEPVINNILASIGEENRRSGFVAAPPTIAPSAAVAAFPGAPAFLSGAGATAAPAPAKAAQVVFDPLVGISAISAEQRVQQAQKDKERKAKVSAWVANRDAQQKIQSRADQLARWKSGVLTPASVFSPLM